MNSFHFPTILSGPIVRRVELEKAYLWIALSKPYDIDASLYKVTSHLSYQLLQTKIETKTVQMGKQLYIYLIEIRPCEDSFPTNTLIGYNLHFRSNSETLDLSSFGLLTLEHPQSIVYGKLKYPTFLIKDNESQILYGSCRKLHSDGEDTLVLADALMEKEYIHLNKRPDSLFLLGDQIYADDIADPLFPVISIIGKHLIGQSENLLQLEHRLNQAPFQTSLSQINGRQYIMENFCQFTSTHSHNHLIEFGEYAAHYLLSWSPDVWDFAQEHQLFRSFEEAVANNEIHFAFTPEEHQVEDLLFEKRKLKKRYEEHQEALTSIPQNLYKIRRLFANISTYMIFDDHDITDDWNLSYDWKINVLNTPLGRHVVANGLSAYWAFQGWGNHPDSFGSSFCKIIRNYFESFMVEGEFNRYHGKWENLLWNFNRWHFVTSTSPKALFLDTRTQREYEFHPQPVRWIKLIEEHPPSPKLINEHGWTKANQLLFDSGWRSNSPLIIASPTPVYGLGLIESFLNDYVYPLRVLGIEIQNQIDYEAWKYNGRGFTEFLELVALWKPSQCIILSGDVHYASAVKSKVTFRNGQVLDIQQYTSSPIKNMSFSGVGGLLMKTIMMWNSLSRKNKGIQRYCDSSYHIVKTIIPPTSYIWTDTLRYLPFEEGSIIETNNNLGLLSISSDAIENKLLENDER
jgi:hypothetical protein